MPSFAIIIPCYNEEKRLDTERFIHFANEQEDVHLYFVNDGSTDDTINILYTIASCSKNVKVLTYRENKGKGEAVREAMACIIQNYTHIGYLDADLSTSLEEFFWLYKQALESNTSVIFASRIQKVDSIIERSFLRHLIGRIIATIIDKKFRLGCYDTQCGAKVFSSCVLETVVHQPFLTRWFFDVELFMRIKSTQGFFEAKEIPLTVWRDVNNSNLTVLSFPMVIKDLFYLLTKY